MIDIHSHILPNIDDGSTGIEMTLEMLKNAEKDGTTKIVATPHYCTGYWESSYSKVKEEINNIRNIAKNNGIGIQIYHGQEIYFNTNLLELYERNIIGTINDTRYMLVELPIREINKQTLDILYELNIKGLTLILAHPERYIEFIDDPNKINDFIDEGILFQLNSGSLMGNFGKSVQKTAQLFLENNIYNFIGSDGHNITNRCTGISKCIENINKRCNGYGDFLYESSEFMLDNKGVKFIGEKIKRKKKFFIFK